MVIDRRNGDGGLPLMMNFVDTIIDWLPMHKSMYRIEGKFDDEMCYKQISYKDAKRWNSIKIVIFMRTLYVCDEIIPESRLSYTEYQLIEDGGWNSFDYFFFGRMLIFCIYNFVLF